MPGVAATPGARRSSITASFVAAFGGAERLHTADLRR
jgi:hypothetical protein